MVIYKHFNIKYLIKDKHMVRYTAHILKMSVCTKFTSVIIQYKENLTEYVCSNCILVDARVLSGQDSLNFLSQMGLIPMIMRSLGPCNIESLRKIYVLILGSLCGRITTFCLLTISSMFIMTSRRLSRK